MDEQLIAYLIGLVGLVFLFLREVIPALAKLFKSKTENQIKLKGAETESAIESAQLSQEVQEFLQSAAKEHYLTILQEVQQLRIEIDKIRSEKHQLELIKTKLENQIKSFEKSLEVQKRELSMAKLELSNSRLEAQTYANKLDVAETSIIRLGADHQDVIDENLRLKAEIEKLQEQHNRNTVLIASKQAEIDELKRQIRIIKEQDQTDND